MGTACEVDGNGDRGTRSEWEERMREAASGHGRFGWVQSLAEDLVSVPNWCVVQTGKEGTRLLGWALVIAHHGQLDLIAAAGAFDAWEHAGVQHGAGHGCGCGTVSGEKTDLVGMCRRGWGSLDSHVCMTDGRGQR